MDWDELIFFDPFTAAQVTTANRLPHWAQAGATYFLTFRLGDAIPAALRAAWETERDVWLKHHPTTLSSREKEEYHARFSQQMDRWLDAGHGSCLLRYLTARVLVERALRYFDGDRYSHHAWVIMPNHVHCLTSVHPSWTPAKLVHSWKSYSAKVINAERGRRGMLWQEDYFDRIIRDPTHFANVVRYIRRNPDKACLGKSEFTLFESEFAREL